MFFLLSPKNFILIFYAAKAMVMTKYNHLFGLEIDHNDFLEHPEVDPGNDLLLRAHDGQRESNSVSGAE